MTLLSSASFYSNPTQQKPSSALRCLHLSCSMAIGPAHSAPDQLIIHCLQPCNEHSWVWDSVKLQIISKHMFHVQTGSGILGYASAPEYYSTYANLNYSALFHLSYLFSHSWGGLSLNIGGLEWEQSTSLSSYFFHHLHWASWIGGVEWKAVVGHCQAL